MRIRVEFFGIPRSRAGVASWEQEQDVASISVARVLELVAIAFPNLREDLEHANGRHIAISVNGERFVSDWQETLVDGDSLLLLSADAGG